MKYMWKASSNDGSYEDDSKIKFDTKKEAYHNMRHFALSKMRWNTEWEDFSDMDKEDYIGYSVKFHRDYIIHESYSGVYTYKVVEVPENIQLYGRVWRIIDSYIPQDMKDWYVATFPDVGEVWMNNYEGFIVIIEKRGRILKSDI